MNRTRFLSRCVFAVAGALLITTQPGCIVFSKTERCAYCREKEDCQRRCEHCGKPCCKNKG